MGRRSGNSTPISFFSFQDIITSVTGILILITLMLALEIVNPQVAEQMPADVAGDIGSLNLQMAARAAAIEQKKDRLQALSQAIEVLGRASPTTAAVQTMELSDASVAFEQLLRTRTSQLSIAEGERDDAKKELDALTAERSSLEEQVRQASAKLVEVSKLGKTKLLPGPSTKKPIVIECSAAGVTVGRVSDEGEVSVITTATARDAIDAVTRVRRTADSSNEYFVLYIHSDGTALGRELVQSLQATAFDVGWDLLGSKQGIFGEVAK